MRNLKLLIILIINFIVISCSEISNKKIVFQKKGKLRHLDFQNIDMKYDGSIKLVKFNYLYQKVISKYGSFSIFLIDYNKNNNFNDSSDIVTIGSINATEPDNLDFSSKIDKKGNYFTINNYPFLLNKYNKKDKHYIANITWLDSVQINKVNDNSKIIDRLPELSFNQINIESKCNFKDFKFKDKYIYVEFWATSCSPCLATIPEIVKLNEMFSNKLEIISMHSEKSANKEIIVKTIEKYKMDWINGQSNLNIKNKFNFGAIPKGFLFDSNGNLIIYNATPQLVKAYLNQN